MNRLFRCLDVGLGLALAAALTLVMLSGWPGTARADDLVVGSGRAATELRPLGEFQAVTVSDGISLRIRQGTQASAQVQADDNLLALLETVIETRGSTPTLQIRWKRHARLRSQVAPSVEVNAVQLEAVASNGSSGVVIDAFTTPRLQLSVSGSGDIRVNDLRSDELAVAVAGSGDVVAAGRALRLGIKVAGSGDVDTVALQADEVSVSIAGSGDVKVHADQKLAVSIAGSGDVTYSGSAALSSKVAGSGAVRKR